MAQLTSLICVFSGSLARASARFSSPSSASRASVRRLSAAPAGLFDPHQEEQESSIERATEDAGLNGMLAALPTQWVGGMLSEHYRAWSFFEYAIFRALAPAQREALSDTLGNVIYVLPLQRQPRRAWLRL